MKGSLTHQAIIRKGAWSDAFLVHNLERGNTFFRKIFHYANIEVVEREFETAYIAWNIGVPTPKPLKIGFSSSLSKYYVDFQYVELKNDIILDNHFSTQLINIIRMMKRINLNETHLRFSWNKNLQEHINAFDVFLKSNQINSENINLVYEAKNKVLNASPINFIHGDLGIHNIGNTFNKLICFDFQSSCYGPYEWDIGYFAGCLNPSELLCFEKYITLHNIWYALFVSGLKIGRKIIRGADLKKSNQNFLDWVSYVKKAQNLE